MTYQPNFKDPRTHKRLRQALGFVVAVMPRTKPHAWSTRYIDKYLGHQGNNLSRYLRDVLLIISSHKYNKDLRLCKTYLLNELGVEFLRSKLLNETDLNWQEFQASKNKDLNWNEYKKDINELVDKLSLNSTNIYPSVIQVQKQRNYLIDKALVTELIKRQYGAELTNLSFTYNDKSNRLWHNIQNVRREFKEDILAEAGLKYQYDISTCAPALILQHAQQLALKTDLDDLDEWMPRINACITDKQRIRQELADSINISVKDAKVIINALFCGARIGNNPDFELSQLLDCDITKIRGLQHNPFIIELKQEIKTCWSVISQSMTREYYITKKGKTRLRAISSKKKWQLYFQLERQALNAINEYLQQTNNRCFLEHDGWSSEFEVEVSELIDFIKTKTGYLLKIDKK